MELQKETVTVRGETYTVRELSVREFLPLIETHGGSDNKSGFSIAILEAAVTDSNGLPVSADTIGAGVYMKLVKPAMRLNKVGDSDEEGSEGND